MICASSRLCPHAWTAIEEAPRHGLLCGGRSWRGFRVGESGCNAEKASSTRGLPVVYKQIPIAENEYLRLRGEAAKVLAGILARLNHEALDQRDAGPRR